MKKILYIFLPAALVSVLLVFLLAKNGDLGHGPVYKESLPDYLAAPNHSTSHVDFGAYVTVESDNEAGVPLTGSDVAASGILGDMSDEIEYCTECFTALNRGGGTDAIFFGSSSMRYEFSDFQFRSINVRWEAMEAGFTFNYEDGCLSGISVKLDVKRDSEITWSFSNEQAESVSVDIWEEYDKTAFKQSVKFYSDYFICTAEAKGREVLITLYSSDYVRLLTLTVVNEGGAGLRSLCFSGGSNVSWTVESTDTQYFRYGGSPQIAVESTMNGMPFKAVEKIPGVVDFTYFGDEMELDYTFRNYSYSGGTYRLSGDSRGTGIDKDGKLPAKAAVKKEEDPRVIPAAAGERTLSFDPETVQPGDYITYGSYEQDGNTDNGAEPLEWLVLAKTDSTVLVISRYVLDAGPFSSAEQGCNWRNSLLRKQLNEDFLNTAFTERERREIAEVRTSPDSETDSIYITWDKLFALSTGEAEEYLGSQEERICTPSACAAGRVRESSGAGADWWLRTEGTKLMCQSYVRADGSIETEDHFTQDIYGKGIGIRPAMYISF